MISVPQVSSFKPRKWFLCNSWLIFIFRGIILTHFYVHGDAIRPKFQKIVKSDLTIAFIGQKNLPRFSFHILPQAFFRIKVLSPLDFWILSPKLHIINKLCKGKAFEYFPSVWWLEMLLLLSIYNKSNTCCKSS